MKKKDIMRYILCVEMVAFGWFYYCGPRGIAAVVELRAENEKLESDMLQLSLDIKSLDMRIKEWKEESFFKEKIAREKLQMARAHEEIYFYDCKDSLSFIAS